MPAPAELAGFGAKTFTAGPLRLLLLQAAYSLRILVHCWPHFFVLGIVEDL